MVHHNASIRKIIFFNYFHIHRQEVLAQLDNQHRSRLEELSMAGGTVVLRMMGCSGHEVPTIKKKEHIVRVFIVDHQEVLAELQNLLSIHFIYIRQNPKC